MFSTWDQVCTIFKITLINLDTEMCHYAPLLMEGRESRKRSHAHSILNFPKQCDDRKKAGCNFFFFFLSFSVFTGRNSFTVNNKHHIGQK